MCTWREQLKAAMKDAGDPGPVIAHAPDQAAFDVEFDARYGLSEGPDMLAWTEANVYFPLVYDGDMWLAYAPRNPVGTGQSHVGGQ